MCAGSSGRQILERSVSCRARFPALIPSGGGTVKDEEDQPRPWYKAQKQADFAPLLIDVQRVNGFDDVNVVGGSATG